MARKGNLRGKKPNITLQESILYIDKLKKKIRNQQIIIDSLIKSIKNNNKKSKKKILVDIENIQESIGNQSEMVKLADDFSFENKENISSNICNKKTLELFKDENKQTNPKKIDTKEIKSEENNNKRNKKEFLIKPKKIFFEKSVDKKIKSSFTNSVGNLKEIITFLKESNYFHKNFFENEEITVIPLVTLKYIGKYKSNLMKSFFRDLNSFTIEETFCFIWYMEMVLNENEKIVLFYDLMVFLEEKNVIFIIFDILFRKSNEENKIIFKGTFLMKIKEILEDLMFNIFNSNDNYEIYHNSTIFDLKNYAKQFMNKFSLEEKQIDLGESIQNIIENRNKIFVDGKFSVSALMIEKSKSLNILLIYAKIKNFEYLNFFKKGDTESESFYYLLGSYIEILIILKFSNNNIFREHVKIFKRGLNNRITIKKIVFFFLKRFGMLKQIEVANSSIYKSIKDVELD